MPDKKRRGFRAKDGLLLLHKVGRLIAHGMSAAKARREIANEQSNPSAALRWLQKEMQHPDRLAKLALDQGQALGAAECAAARNPGSAVAAAVLVDDDDVCCATESTVDPAEVRAIAAETGVPDEHVLAVLSKLADRTK